MPRKASKNLSNLYKSYKKSYEEVPLEEKEFKEGAKFIFNSIIENLFKGKRCPLPYGLGTLFIDFYKLKGKQIDFGTSKKIGKVVYFTNLHSDGLTYKVKWEKVSSRFKNKKLYSFRLSRRNSRQLSKLIKQNKIKVFKYYG